VIKYGYTIAERTKYKSAPSTKWKDITYTRNLGSNLPYGLLLRVISAVQDDRGPETITIIAQYPNRMGKGSALESVVEYKVERYP
jgi:hypothetical protein